MGLARPDRGADSRENKLFKGLSFDTISSTGPNAAVIHYSPPEQGSAVIDKNQVYLCDSGAQYMDGTTDVTRTLVNLHAFDIADSSTLAPRLPRRSVPSPVL